MYPAESVHDSGSGARVSVVFLLLTDADQHAAAVCGVFRNTAPTAGRSLPRKHPYFILQDEADDDLIEKIERVTWVPDWVPFSVPGTGVLCRAHAAAWIGRTGSGVGQTDGADDGYELVYVAENGSVYHTDSTCTHIDLSVHAAAGSDLGRLRNVHGGKYHACEKCVGNGRVSGTIYITDEGDRYHNDAGCSGLKRTVRLLRKSELDGLPVCSRCAEKEAGHGS